MSIKPLKRCYICNLSYVDSSNIRYDHKTALTYCIRCATKCKSCGKILKYKGNMILNINDEDYCVFCVKKCVGCNREMPTSEKSSYCDKCIDKAKKRQKSLF